MQRAFGNLAGEQPRETQLRDLLHVIEIADQGFAHRTHRAVAGRHRRRRPCDPARTRQRTRSFPRRGQGSHRGRRRHGPEPVPARRARRQDPARSGRRRADRRLRQLSQLFQGRARQARRAGASDQGRPVQIGGRTVCVEPGVRSIQGSGPLLDGRTLGRLPRGNLRPAQDRCEHDQRGHRALRRARRRAFGRSRQARARTETRRSARDARRSARAPAQQGRRRRQRQFPPGRLQDVSGDGRAAADAHSARRSPSSSRRAKSFPANSRREWSAAARPRS